MVDNSYAPDPFFDLPEGETEFSTSFVLVAEDQPELQAVLDDLRGKLGEPQEFPNIPAANDDLDADAIADTSDNCPASANPLQEDRNADNQGDACTYTCDLVLDGRIDGADGMLAIRVANEGSSDSGLLARADVAPATGGPTDGQVMFNDAMVVLRAASGEELEICNPLN